MAKAAPVKHDVTLTTGETVAFGEKQKLMKSSDLKDGHATVRLAFRNGEVREFGFDKHHKLLMRLAIHGALQKLGDEVSGIEDLDDQVSAVDSLVSRLEAGEWGAERAAGGGFNGASIVVRAIAEVRGETPAETAKWVEAKLAEFEAKGTPITRAAFYARFREPGAKTAPVIARLEAEKAAKKKPMEGPSADDLLAD